LQLTPAGLNPVGRFGGGGGGDGNRVRKSMKVKILQ
jgi:hypothetical protein